VGVVLGEDQGLRDGGAAGEDLGEEPVAECLQDEADLGLGGDGSVELFVGVLVVLLELLEALEARSAVDLGDEKAGVDRAALFGDLGADPVEVEVDVDPVGDGLRVGVLGDEVLPKEREGLLARGRGQPDNVGVEVLQHAAPHAVDRAVRLVDDDQVERLRRQQRVVGNRDGGVGDEVVQAGVVLTGDLLVLDRLEDALDR